MFGLLWAVFFVLFPCVFLFVIFPWTVFFGLFSSSRFCFPLTSCFILCFVFIEPFSSRLCLFLPGVLAPLTFFFCLITFSFLSSWVFFGPFSWCFFLSFVLFVLFSLVHFLCVVFFVPLLRPFCFVSLHRSFYSPPFLPVFVSSFPEFSPC